MDHPNESYHYRQIARAIVFIGNNFKTQPDLETVAGEINMSPFHFQRLFTEWAGVSPKKFLQYISLQHAKKMLKKPGTTLFEAAFETGLSGTGRLHDLFVTVEAMTPGEYKLGGRELTIRYSFAPSPFGEILIASTPKGICSISFAEKHSTAIDALRRLFPDADYREGSDKHQQRALEIFSNDLHSTTPIHLHLKGTPFQLKVWESLLKIPMGHLSTYGSIANSIDAPKASRAVGTAVGKNPVAYLIPCHRVIQSTGALGGYMWGPVRKKLITGWEAAQINR